MNDHGSIGYLNVTRWNCGMFARESMASKLGEQPAFPVPDSAVCRNTISTDGMTYRQWLVGMALQNLAGTNSPDEVSRACVAFADAVLAELEKH